MLHLNIFESADALVAFVNDIGIVQSDIQAIFEKPNRFYLLWWGAP